MDSSWLAHSLLTADGSSPEKWVVFLHGIFGSGANWRSFARRLVQAKPWWGAALVDLRLHGSSLGFAPPHSVAAAAQDVLALEKTLPGPVRALVGHSFGGKVALRCFGEQADVLEQVWLLDAMPGPRPDHHGSETTVRVLELLTSLPSEWTSREAFIAELVKAGQTREIAGWLAMNLSRNDDRPTLRLRLDLAGVRSLLDDYFSLDLWPLLESPPGRATLHVVIGGKSNVFAEDERARLEAIARNRPERVRVHVLPEAGHWVHVDDPDGLLRAMVESF
jgi:pimeloyl-ACP methyl ester carboxylesterase